MSSIKSILNEKMSELVKNKKNVGIAIKCKKTDKILLLKRNHNPYKDYWALLSGKVDKNEEPMEAMIREIREEIGLDALKLEIRVVSSEINHTTNTQFTFYLGIINDEFVPNLNKENSEYKWVKSNELPTPLFPRLEEKLKNI
jgi:8-oxo-dGTP diphosphatase